MSKQPPPVMSPIDLPRQHLYLVKDFNYLNDQSNASLAVAGLSGVPRAKPRSAAFICQAEWSWSPAHHRIENYFISLNTKRSHWVLWVSCYNDWEWPWRWETYSDVCIVLREGLTKVVAAKLLLSVFWRSQRDEQEIDKFHWIGALGLLDIAGVQGVGRAVWSDD